MARRRVESAFKHQNDAIWHLSPNFETLIPKLREREGSSSCRLLPRRPTPVAAPAWHQQQHRQRTSNNTSTAPPPPAHQRHLQPIFFLLLLHPDLRFFLQLIARATISISPRSPGGATTMVAERRWPSSDGR